MEDKLKVFWNLDVLVKMCRSKSDGPSLRIEEEEIIEKIDAYNIEIEEIKVQSEEDSYDTSAEMADRNIEIITKKQLQTLKATLKEKNKELNKLKEEELTIYSNSSLLRDNKISQEKYITSMQERINEATDYEVIDRYNGLIAETTEKIAQLVDELENYTDNYEKVQERILKISNEISEIEDKILKKKKLLAETQANLENKANYIDKTKKEKADKKINEIESKIKKSTNRLDEIRKDPKYLESKIKTIINNKEDIEKAIPYLVDLINLAIKVPYINVPADNLLEEELLKATQARDSFANEIEQKTYNILEANTPEKVRIEFLNDRITLWNKELEELKTKVDLIDRDQEYNYEAKNQEIQKLIDVMKKDLREYEKAYYEVPELNVGAKTSIKAAMDEKRVDILEAEKIVTAFRKDESDDIAKATQTIKYECERLYQNIQNAEKEIESIKSRLTSKKSGLIDISAKNKDKDTLKELAQIVIDIKHRRQFPETPLEIVSRLEEELKIDLSTEINNTQIENTSNIVQKDYEEFNNISKKIKRGIKVVSETDVDTDLELDKNEMTTKNQAAEEELKSLINDIESNEQEQQKEQIVETLDTLDVEQIPKETLMVEKTASEPEIIKEDEIEPTSEETVMVENASSVENETETIDTEPVVENDSSEEIITIAEPTTEENPAIVEEETKEESVQVIDSEPIVEEEQIPIVVSETIIDTPEETTGDETNLQASNTLENSTPEINLAPTGEIAPTSEELPVEMPVESTEEETELDEQIDNLISSTKTEEPEDEEPLDIDAMFENPNVATEESQLENKKLSIDTIFNVDIGKIDLDETTNENLANDFDKYLNDLEKTEA